MNINSRISQIDLLDHQGHANSSLGSVLL